MVKQELLPLEQIDADLWGIARSGGPDPEVAVEAYLEGVLAGLAPGARLRSLEELLERFSPQPAAPDSAPTGAPQAEMTRLILQFLGTPGDHAERSPAEILEKFAGSLGALFDSLNEIISVINVRLLGQSPELETIRKVIGATMEKGGDNLPIKEYLDQIKQAFLAAHGSFQTAAATVVAEVLTELDPARLLSVKNSSLKFGPLRKAELFEQYEEKHARCRRWFDSGQYQESLVREFEKNCRQNFRRKLG